MGGSSNDVALNDFESAFNSLITETGNVVAYLGPLGDFLSALKAAPSAVMFGGQFLSDLGDFFGGIGVVVDASDAENAITSSDGDPGKIAAAIFGFWFDASWTVLGVAASEVPFAAAGLLITEQLFDDTIRAPALAEVQYLVDSAVGYNPANSSLQVSSAEFVLNLPAGASATQTQSETDGLYQIVTGSQLITANFNNQGLIEANGGVIDISSTVTGGTLLTDTSGTIHLNPGSFGHQAALLGVTLGGDGSGGYLGDESSFGDALQAVTIQAGVTFTSSPGNETALGGVIDNAGVLVSDAGPANDLVVPGGYFVVNGPVTLEGGGTLQIDGFLAAGSEFPGAGFLLNLTPGSDVLTNVNNTITGDGAVDVALINQTAGVIDSQGLTFNQALTNDGLVEALSGQSLSLAGAGINNNVIQAEGGTISVSGTLSNNGTFEANGGGLIDIIGEISGGTLLADTSGAVHLVHSSHQETALIGVTLGGDGTGGYFADANLSGGDALQDISIQSGVAFTSSIQNVTALGGVVDNAGVLISAAQSNTLSLAPAGTFLVNGPVTLDGAGTLEIDGLLEGAASYPFPGFFLNLTPGPDLLTNVDNTIDGSGAIYVDLINQANGVIDGQGLAIDGALTNDGLVEVLSGHSIALNGAVIDSGSIEAATGGVLTATGVVSGSGSIEIDGGSVALRQVGAGVRIQFEGGTLSLSSASLVSTSFGGKIIGFGGSDAIDFAGTVTHAAFAGGMLTLTNGQTVVAQLQLAGDYGDAHFTATAEQGFTEIQVSGAASPASDDFNADGKSDFLIQNTSGAVVVGEDVGGAANYAQVSGLGSEWSFRGTGDYLGDGRADYLIENTVGSVYVGEISGGSVSYTAVAGLGPEWSFRESGDFLGRGDSQFLIENTAGAVYAGEVVGGQAAYTLVADLGPEWTFVGAGDFLGEGHDQFLIENTAGAVYVGDTVNGQTSYTQVAGLGPEWSFRGAGDFLGDGKADFLIENTAGAIYAGEVVAGQASYTLVADLGPEWKFIGTGDYLGEGHNQFLIENTAGQVDIGDFTGGQIHYTQIASLGSEWAFH